MCPSSPAQAWASRASRVCNIRECSLRKDTGFVERALRHAAAYRARQGHPLDDAIHHSDYAEVCVKPRVCGDGLCSCGVLADFSA